MKEARKKSIDEDIETTKFEMVTGRLEMKELASIYSKLILFRIRHALLVAFEVNPAPSSRCQSKYSVMLP